MFLDDFKTMKAKGIRKNLILLQASCLFTKFNAY